MDHLRLPEPPLVEEDVDGVAGFGLGLADDHALTCGQPVGLQHGGVVGVREVRRRLLGRPENGVAGGGDPSLRHQLLGVDLRAFEPRGLAGRSERGDPSFLEGVDDPADQWSLGPDHDKVGRFRARKLDDRLDVLGTGREDPRVFGDAGVAGRAEDLRASLRAAERPHDRMLATPAADDEDLHERLFGRTVFEFRLRSSPRTCRQGSPSWSRRSSCRASRARRTPWPSSPDRALRPR